MTDLGSSLDPDYPNPVTLIHARAMDLFAAEREPHEVFSAFTSFPDKRHLTLVDGPEDCVQISPERREGYFRRAEAELHAERAFGKWHDLD